MVRKEDHQSILIAGPTASGKSKLAIEIALELGYEIYSTDSRQCYKGLPIGTAAPTINQQEQVYHHNVAVLEPYEIESAAYFIDRLKLAFPVIQNDKPIELPLVFVGGSTLNNESLLFELNDLPKANEENLKELTEALDQHGPMHLLEKLQQVDPVYANNMEGFNKQRCFRALDVWMQTGKAFSSFHNKRSKQARALTFVVETERTNLYQQINERVDWMWTNGLIEEYKSIIESGITKDAHALQSLGYQEVESYLNGIVDQEEAKERMKTRSRRYAKRQITWYKRWNFAIKIPANAIGLSIIRKTLERHAKHS